MKILSGAPVVDLVLTAFDADGATQTLPDHADARCDGEDAPTQLLSRRGALALSLALPACGAIERGTAVPAVLQDSATIPGIPNARFWGYTQVDALRAEVFAALEREARHLGLASGREPPKNPDWFKGVCRIGA
jgi:hypothetical protein